jgi:hypothetical protein
LPLRGPPPIDDELNVAVEQMEKGDELAQAFARIGWIEQSVELRH